MNKIDKIRLRKGLSYNSIAREAGLTSAYICYLAKGKRKNPSLEAMQKISNALGEKVETVFYLNRKEGVI
ncbi:DNA-binding protein [Clostridium acetobutylicum]|nr:DNA-binding protein [Clostridium acetobutylicum]